MVGTSLAVFAEYFFTQLPTHRQLSQHPHRLLVSKSRVHPVGWNESVLCVNWNIPVCLSVFSLVQRWAPPVSTMEEQASLRSLSIAKNSTFSAALCLSMYLVCVSDEHLAKTLARLSGTLPHILHMVLIWSEVYRSYKPCKLGLIRAAHKVP